MVERGEEGTHWQRTRRSIVAIGAILAGVAISGVNRVHADEHDRDFGDHDRRFRDHDREFGDRDPSFRDHDHGFGDHDHDFRDHDHGFGDRDHGFGDHDHGSGHHGGPACYLRGTRILTPSGERKIESLRKGDLVITVSGETKPIEWIGGRRYHCIPGQGWRASIRPVRVVTGALAPEVPHRDLFLSQEHHLLLDGGLIRAGDLINGASICLDPLSGFREIEYLHIKLASHDVIYAEGAATETLLLNPVSVAKFDDLIAYERLFSTRAERACVPVYSVAVSGRRGQILSHMRSAISPWVDRRTQFDKIRDRVCDRASAARPVAQG